MLIDFHTHVFPEKIASRAIAKLEDGIVRVQGGKVLAANTDGTLLGLLGSMDKYGVDISVVMPIATTLTQHRSINSFAQEISKNERIISFGSLHPMQEDWEQTLYYIAREGRKGIKLHPEFQDFYVDEERVFDIVKKAKELNLLVLFHSGADLGYPPPVRCTPQRLRRVIDKCGGENIIAAHFGGFKMWGDVKKYLLGTPVMMDTSMISGYLDKELFIDIIRTHGADKFLFGTDSPWQTPADALTYLENSSLTKDELEMIKYKNAKKLLSL